MTAGDPLTGAEILHWLNTGAPDGWSWPYGMNPWELVEKLAAALVAVLDTVQHWDDDACDHDTGHCVCGQFQLRAKIATSLGVEK